MHTLLPTIEATIRLTCPHRSASASAGEPDAELRDAPRVPPLRRPHARRSLAAWAVERASRADDRSADRPPAARTRLAGPVVDRELALHAALAAAAIAIRAERRAVQPDRLPQHPAQRLMQPRDLVGAERSGEPQWMDPGAPERLGGVDVPDPGDAPLIQEQRLDRRAPAPAQERAQPLDGEGPCERLAAHGQVERCADRALAAGVG